MNGNNNAGDRTRHNNSDISPINNYKKFWATPCQLDGEAEDNKSDDEEYSQIIKGS